MAAFMDAFRLPRKKAVQIQVTPTSHPTNNSHKLISGGPYGGESDDEYDPGGGLGLNSTDKLGHLAQQTQDLSLQSHPTLNHGEPGTIQSTQSPLPYTVHGDYVTFVREPKDFSLSTQQRAKALKLSTELFYNRSVGFAVERNKRAVELEQQIKGDRKMSETKKSRLVQQQLKQEDRFLRLRRARLSVADFAIIKVIGRGAYGEVCLVQKTDNGKMYAMKTILKSKMGENDLAHIKAERDIMADSESPWVVNLFYSFQDNEKLYLIMEFLPGGDMMTMLIKYEIFSEDVTRFYIAEIVLAIEAVHAMGFIHRDIKPDNILLDKDGHVKLSDFGLSTGFRQTHDTKYYQKLLEQGSKINRSGDQEKTTRNTVLVDNIRLTISDRTNMNTWRKSRRLMAYSTVGTPDYIAPEVLEKSGYTQDCDWWSLGAIMYECLVGWPPFCSEDQATTTYKIANFKEHFYFPDEIPMSYEAEDLICSLMQPASKRLGRNGTQDIKAHPFFLGVDWDDLRKVQAPFKPSLASITDTSNFPEEKDLLVDHQHYHQQLPHDGYPTGEEPALPFIGYTYKRFSFPIL